MWKWAKMHTSISKHWTEQPRGLAAGITTLKAVTRRAKTIMR